MLIATKTLSAWVSIISCNVDATGTNLKSTTSNDDVRHQAHDLTAWVILLGQCGFVQL